MAQIKGKRDGRRIEEREKKRKEKKIMKQQR